MARLFGFIGNRPDLGSRAIAHEKQYLSLPNNPLTPLGWGVGFYQNGEVLLKRKPIEDRPEIRIAEITQNLRTDLLIAHVRNATVGTQRTENTHPFRYRQWLFASTGTIEAFPRVHDRLIDSLPQFLQRSVLGDTDSELLFYLFLSFLHDAGVLDRATVEPSQATAAIRSSLSLIDRLSAEEGAGANALNILACSPDYLLATHGAATMRYRTFRGPSDMELLLADGGLGRMRIPDYADSFVTLVASDFSENLEPEQWKKLPPGSIAVFSRTGKPIVEAI